MKSLNTVWPRSEAVEWTGSVFLVKFCQDDVEVVGETCGETDRQT